MNYLKRKMAWLIIFSLILSNVSVAFSNGNNNEEVEATTVENNHDEFVDDQTTDEEEMLNYSSDDDEQDYNEEENNGEKSDIEKNEDEPEAYIEDEPEADIEEEPEEDKEEIEEKTEEINREENNADDKSDIENCEVEEETEKEIKQEENEDKEDKLDIVETNIGDIENGENNSDIENSETETETEIKEVASDDNEETINDTEDIATISEIEDSNNLDNLLTTTEHTHKECGIAESSVCNHSGIDAHTEVLTYEPLTSSDTFPKSGKYYLTEDLSSIGAITITADLYLCLHGHTISGITFNASKYALRITNCSEDSTTITATSNSYFAKDVSLYIISSKGQINLKSDYIYYTESSSYETYHVFYNVACSPISGGSTTQDISRNVGKSSYYNYCIMSNTTISGYTVPYNKCLMYNSYSYIKFYDTTISNNYVNVGYLLRQYNSVCTLDIYNSTFDSNTVSNSSKYTTYGSVIYTTCTTTINDSTFTNNTVYSYLIHNTASITYSGDNNFTNNTYGRRSTTINDAMFQIEGVCTFKEGTTTIDSNTSYDQARGIIYNTKNITIDDGANVKITNNTIKRATSIAQGIMYGTSGTKLNMTGTSSLTITGNTINCSANTSNSNPIAGIYFNTSSYINIATGTVKISDNQATNDSSTTSSNHIYGIYSCDTTDGIFVQTSGYTMDTTNTYINSIAFSSTYGNGIVYKSWGSIEEVAKNIFVADTTKHTNLQTVLYNSHVYIMPMLTINYNFVKPSTATDSDIVVGSMDSKTYYYVDSNTVYIDNEFDINGYTFDGFATTSGGDVVYEDGDSITITSMSSSTLDLYTVWTENYYNMVFKASPDEEEVSKEKVLYSSINTYTNPTWGTHTFYGFVVREILDENGYNIENDKYGTKYLATPNTEISRAVYENNATIYFYGAWDVNYYIAFDLNKPSSVTDDKVLVGIMATVSVTANTETELPSCTFEIVDEEFQGWTDVKGSNVVKYEDKAKVFNLTQEEGAIVTLYAIWNSSYRLVFHSHKPGERKKNEQVVFVDVELNENYTMKSLFSMSGSNIISYNTKASGYGTNYLVGSSYTNILTSGKLDLYAIWIGAGGGGGSISKSNNKKSSGGGEKHSGPISDDKQYVEQFKSDAYKNYNLTDNNVTWTKTDKTWIAYNNDTNSMITDGLYFINWNNKDCYYAFDKAGNMVTGFVLYQGNTYLLDNEGTFTGAMFKNKVKIFSTEYELNEDGSMRGELHTTAAFVYDIDYGNYRYVVNTPTELYYATNTNVTLAPVNGGDDTENYFFDENGYMRTGLFDADRYTFYAYESGPYYGQVAKGTILVNGQYMTFGEDHRRIY